jgi:hypothetical protein
MALPRLNVGHRGALSKPSLVFGLAIAPPKPTLILSNRRRFSSSEEALPCVGLVLDSELAMSQEPGQVAPEIATRQAYEIHDDEIHGETGNGQSCHAGYSGVRC